MKKLYLITLLFISIIFNTVMAETATDTQKIASKALQEQILEIRSEMEKNISNIETLEKMIFRLEREMKGEAGQVLIGFIVIGIQKIWFRKSEHLLSGKNILMLLGYGSVAKGSYDYYVKSSMAVKISKKLIELNKSFSRVQNELSSKAKRKCAILEELAKFEGIFLPSEIIDFCSIENFNN